jgi:hypothetical protein
MRQKNNTEKTLSLFNNLQCDMDDTYYTLLNRSSGAYNILNLYYNLDTDKILECIIPIYCLLSRSEND